MEALRPRILIAAPVPVIRELRLALGEPVEVIGAETWDRALAELRRSAPALIVVCYAFDEMRPFRLVHYLRRRWRRPRLPVILVRALPVALGRTQEAEIRESYLTLGVDDFINLYDTGQHGDAGRPGTFPERGFRAPSEASRPSRCPR